MAEEQPDRTRPVGDPLPQAPDLHRDDPEEDDGFLSASLAGLSKVNVPTGFLPGVMFRVYEKHHREKVSLPFILTSALGLLVLCVLAFCLDVAAFGKARGSAGFGAAFDARLEGLSDYVGSLVGDMGGLLSATWQIVSGAAAAGSTSTLIFLVLGLILVLYLIKRGLSALMG